MLAARVLLIACTLALSGCALLSQFEDNAAEQLAKAVKSYCSNTDPAYRERFQAIADAKLAPNKVIVGCNTP